jgi:hypothetical protein
MAKEQTRIIELQKQVSIARGALLRISNGGNNPEVIAERALDKMWPLDLKQPLQGVVGHERRSR